MAASGSFQLLPLLLHLQPGIASLTTTNTSALQARYLKITRSKPLPMQLEASGYEASKAAAGTDLVRVRGSELDVGWRRLLELVHKVAVALVAVLGAEGGQADGLAGDD